jgi:CRISPR system Cascade subunit CasE
MTGLFLSRVRLQAGRGEALSAIAPLLIPKDPKQQPGHSHRVLWLLFQDIPESKRDFLWRDEGDGRYMILSQRPPTDPHNLFELATKPFAPELSVGDRLAFSMRANPVIASKPARAAAEQGTRARGQKVDVVMHALKDVPKTDWNAKTGRAFERDQIASKAGGDWLAAQGAKAGFRFAPDTLPLIDGYAQIAVERKKGRPAGFSVLDFKGLLEITDPAAFMAKLVGGFGSAKAFGNGLMLIRRA